MTTERPLSLRPEARQVPALRELSAAQTPCVGGGLRPSSGLPPVCSTNDREGYTVIIYYQVG